MLFTTILSVISTSAIVAALIGAGVQLRLYNRQRARESALQLAHSFRTAEFLVAVNIVFDLPEGLSRKDRRPGGAGRTWRAALLAVLLVGASVLAASGSIASDRAKLPEPNAKQRLDSIRRARVWEPTDVSAKNLFRGPEGRLPYAVDDEVSCEFVPKPMSGWTTKFSCRLEDGTIVKVKYDEGGRYKEVFGEVLGTRLFWALGFYADRMLPVHMTCRGCPQHPFEFVDRRKKLPLNDKGDIISFPPGAKLGTYRFDLAIVEEKSIPRPSRPRTSEDGAGSSSTGWMRRSGGPRKPRSTLSSCSMRSFRTRTTRPSRTGSSVREPRSRSTMRAV